MPRRSSARGTGTSARSPVDRLMSQPWSTTSVRLMRATMGAGSRPSANSAVELLLVLLPGVPVITVDSAARLIGRSEMRTGEAVNRLEAAGVLRQRNMPRRRYRVFEATDVIELFTGLERALASPAGDTTAAPPIRLVLHRARAGEAAMTHGVGVAEQFPRTGHRSATGYTQDVVAQARS